MTQSAGGPHSSFQPIIQTESAFQAWSLQVFYFFLFSLFILMVQSVAWAESHICLPLQMAAGWLSDVVTAQHLKRNEVSYWFKTDWLHDNILKASGIRCGGCHWGGNDGLWKGLTVRDSVVRADCPETGDSASICHFVGKRRQCAGSLNHWFDKVLQQQT